MPKICKCANPKCGHCIIQGQGEFIHVTGGKNGKAYTICPICGCNDPKPNPDDGDCESLEAYLKHGLEGECE